MQCRHCQKTLGIRRRRALCRRCHDDPAIRALYPSQSSHGRRLRGQHCDKPDFEGEATMPAATETMPGTDEKIAVMGERETADEALFNAEQDARLMMRPEHPEWVATLPDGEVLGGLHARTKSEARMWLKLLLALRNRFRGGVRDDEVKIPSGTVLERAPARDKN